MIEIRKREIRGYEKIDIKNDWFEAGITPELGGKILSFADSEGDIFFCFDKFDYLPKGIEKQENIIEYRKKLRYMPPGGYKTWLAPQDNWGWPPYIELEAGTYSYRINKTKESINVELLSGRCRESGISIMRNIKITDKNCLEIDEKITNFDEHEKDYGIWGVTQIKRKGNVIFPLKTKDDIKSLGECSWQEKVKYIEVNNNMYAVVNCDERLNFKIGTAYSNGWVLTLIDGERIRGYLKKFPVYEENSLFGHGCAIEIYNSPAFEYFEVEVHSPKVLLKKGESSINYEKWSMYHWERETGIEKIIAEIEKNL